MARNNARSALLARSQAFGSSLQRKDLFIWQIRVSILSLLNKLFYATREQHHSFIPTLPDYYKRKGNKLYSTTAIETKTQHSHLR